MNAGVGLASSPPPVGLVASDCWTPLGKARETLHALLAGETALQSVPVLATEGDPVPLALMNGTMVPTLPPRWWAQLLEFATPLRDQGWGTARQPIFLTSSNYGVDSLLALYQGGEKGLSPWSSAHGTAEKIAGALGWGENRQLLSHACVTAHLGLNLAALYLHNGLADRALVFSFDFVSPFVAGGFHALKILNGQHPQPYADRDAGAIALGDGAAYAILSKESADLVVSGQCLTNEMYHLTNNDPSGESFDHVGRALATAAEGARIWIKGHGTGTLEAGKLEAEAVGRSFPECPLVGWKGALGHTLGSCGLVELAIVAEAFREGRAPGTVGSQPPFFSANVTHEPFSIAEYTAAALLSNAFGGAHAACLLRHA